MSIITAKSPHDSSFSFSRRYFHWKNNADDDDDEILSTTTASVTSHSTNKLPKKPYYSISKLKSALAFTFFSKTSSTRPVIGTIFGRRRGHVRFALQPDPKSNPCFLIELATPTSVLVREMASGLVRIALECERNTVAAAAAEKMVQLLEEPLWRAYCNGRKCGYANNKRECGDEEWKVLKAVEAITMGAGVLPLPASAAGVGSGMRQVGPNPTERSCI